jgi:hypothetical protein
MKNKLALVITILVIGSIISIQHSFASKSNVKVGLYYYPWYAEGNGSRHWNSVAPPNDTKAWTVVDTPVLGFYNSQNTTIIKQHLEWFKELGIDFLIVSWWGANSYEDNSTKFLFSTVMQNNYSISIAIMVEAYNWSGIYHFKTIYDYIQDTYVSPYQNIYMKLNDFPLICFYNDKNMTDNTTQRTAIYNDNRFATRIIGHNDYVDWWFGTPCSVNNSTLPILSRNDSMICIEPRYDDQFLGRTQNSTSNENLSEGLYDKQWNEALRLTGEGKVNYVTIYSWNEYHERSQIEPQQSKDGGYTFSPFYETKTFIDEIKSIEEPSLLSSIIGNLDIIALFLIGIGSEKYFVSRLTTFSNSIALLLFFLRKNFTPWYVTGYLFLGLLIGIFGYIAYVFNESLPEEYYDISLLYSSLIAGIVMLLGTLLL